MVYFQILNKTEVYMEKLIIYYHLLSLDHQQLIKKTQGRQIFSIWKYFEHMNIFLRLW